MFLSVCAQSLGLRFPEGSELGATRVGVPPFSCPLCLSCRDFWIRLRVFHRVKNCEINLMGYDQFFVFFLME